MTTDKNKVADGILADIKYICKTFGSRNAGGEGEKLTAEYFTGELSGCADEVEKEEFRVNPSAFTGWIPFSVTCVLLAIVAYFFSSLVSLLLLIVGVLPVLTEYLFFVRAIDPLYAEKTSQNVTAIKRCSETPEKRIYFVANMDANFENTIKYRLGGIMLVALLVLDFLGFFYFAAISIARWALIGGVGASIVSGPMLYAGLAGLAFVPSLIASYFMISTKTVVDGANNNLTGCFVASRALAALKDTEFKNTEVGVILTGSGAVGLRGSKAWCEAHADGIDRENTVFISITSLRELGYLNANSNEMNGFARCDKSVNKLVLDSAKSLGLKCANHRIPFEASDCATFIRKGFKSTGICAINTQLPDYYYTRYDSYDNLSAECIGESYALVLEIIKNYSGEGGEFVYEAAESAPEVSAETAKVAEEARQPDVNTTENKPENQIE